MAITRFIISRVRDEHLAQPKLKKADWKFLAPAILAGGVLAPVLLMSGLTSTPASVASLLLNTEGIFTAVIAWVVFKENYDRRILLGMVAIAFDSTVGQLHCLCCESSYYWCLSMLGDR